jgi:hypothetical protein
VSWRVVSALAIGTSHIANGTPCQDDCWALVQGSGGGDVLTIFVADGAGSAIKGGEGAAAAVQAAASFFTEAIADPKFTLSPALAADCIEAVRTGIAAQAQGAALTTRDYSCTFLGLVSTLTATLAFQVGDGAIVLDVGNGLELMTSPMAGEYANMTHFVTQSDCLEVMEVKLFSSPAKRVAVFSDGLQRLALNMALGTPHEPFFTPFFDVLAKATEAQEDVLQAQLAGFLNSSQVNERTDDDKSLALAVMTGQSSQ